MTGPQYTSCVKPEDYEDYSTVEVIATADVWEAADYMLHRKLVCLGSVHPGYARGTPCLVRSPDAGTSCAIGRVMSFEPPSAKSFPESIDNDFSFNILLRPSDAGSPDPSHPYPFGLSDNPFVNPGWVPLSEAVRLAAVRNGYQGEFLVEQETPRPHEANDGDPRYGGYTSEMYFDATGNRSGTASLVLGTRLVWFVDGSVHAYPAGAPGAYSVPVLHCECEGSRVNDIFQAADAFPGSGAGCKKHWYTKLACALLRAIFLPFSAPTAATAWVNARDGDYHDAMVGNGDLSVGDLVVVTGRWVFDAGHKGHNEIHAVRTIQKIPDQPGEPVAGSPPPGDFEGFYKDWCGLWREVPPDHPPGERPADMTSTQSTVYDNQQKPENQYLFHPDLDGCRPRLQPLVRGVEPASVQRGTGEVSVLVLGSGFVNGAEVTVVGPAVPVKAVTFESASRLAVTLALTSATPTGPRQVVVKNPDKSSASCAGCLAITDDQIIR